MPMFAGGFRRVELLLQAVWSILTGSLRYAQTAGLGAVYQTPNMPWRSVAHFSWFTFENQPRNLRYLHWP
jgi:hypothetical protein